MADVGRLSVRVSTSRAELPVEGATVVVTQDGEDGTYKLLSVQVTDSSGLVRTIEIPTPETGESTHPNGGTPAGFALCNVWAEHPGYAMLQVSGVQIFPGVETIQNMKLIPLAEGQSSLQHRDARQVTAQNL